MTPTESMTDRRIVATPHAPGAIGPYSQAIVAGGFVHCSGQIGLDPARDMEVIEIELALADLDTVARALDRATKKARTGDKDAIAERDTLEKARAGALPDSK